jgi:hypothetical protein
MTQHADDQVDLGAPCEHAPQAKIHIGGQWVHLRECLTCGHVACCDSSPNRHATAHFHASKHPIVTSLEPGEHWTWCYIDEVTLSAEEE